jgi:hypothetical protein
MPPTAIGELTAFCPTCLPPEGVTFLLQSLGFRLDFQMGAVIYPAYTQTPGLPAQYHYREKYGTEIIYLAGRDVALNGERFPRHASRFWVYPGSDAGACQRIVAVMAVRWLLTWLRSPRPNALADAD